MDSNYKSKRFKQSKVLYSDDVNDEFNYKCMKSKYERKNENYKQQDRKAKRTIPKEGYVNVKCFLII